ncbi:MAG: Holliday junction resolvase RuvX [Pseudomonadota bacterium]
MQEFPQTGALLALDISKNRIGVAGTDPDRLLVTPLLTLDRKTADKCLAHITAIARERRVTALVVGWPLNMDGSEGPACQAVAAMAQPIVDALALPVRFQDERLTSAAVADAIEEGRLRRPKRGEPTDHYAAAVILEDALRELKLHPG